MTDISNTYAQLHGELSSKSVQLVAVSKIQPVEKIMQLYNLGHRDFGENYVQELLDKHAKLPADINWHFIGHLQSNKVKQVVPFVTLIHGVDSLRLLKEINKQAGRLEKPVAVLLQRFIADEETKFGLDSTELDEIMSMIDEFPNVQVRGLMGMASFSDDHEKVKREFTVLRAGYEQYLPLFSKWGNPILSMGMSGDYELAIAKGSNLVRIGSLLFGARKLQP